MRFSSAWAALRASSVPEGAPGMAAASKLPNTGPFFQSVFRPSRRVQAAVADEDRRPRPPRRLLLQRDVQDLVLERPERVRDLDGPGRLAVGERRVPLQPPRAAAAACTHP